MVKRLRIKIFGLVQGVGLRWWLKTKAEELGLVGFAANEPDGSVYLEVEGEEKKLKKFLGWCRRGPSGAQVEKVEFKYTDRLKNFARFSIL